MSEYIKSLQKMLMLVEGERDQLLQMNQDIANTHSKSLTEMSKSRARNRWDTARKRTQTEETMKKMKVRMYS